MFFLYKGVHFEGSKNVRIANTQVRPDYRSGESVGLYLVHGCYGLALVDGHSGLELGVIAQIFSHVLSFSHFLLGAIVRTMRQN